MPNSPNPPNSPNKESIIRSKDKDFGHKIRLILFQYSIRLIVNINDFNKCFNKLFHQLYYQFVLKWV